MEPRRPRGRGRGPWVAYQTFAEQALLVAVFAAVGFAIVYGTILLSRILVGTRPKTGAKLEVYESGEVTIGTTEVRVSVHYYLYALLFLIFDVEAALLFPWAPAFDRLGWLGVFEVVVFVLILAAGLAYAWLRGVLKWVY